MSSTLTKDQQKLRKYEKTRKVFVRTSFIGIFLLLIMLFGLITSFLNGITSSHTHYNRMQAAMFIVFLLPVFSFIGMCDYLPKGQKPKRILRVLITSYVVLLLGTFILILVKPFFG